MKNLFKTRVFVLCVLCLTWFLGSGVSVLAMENGYFMETSDGGSSEGYEEKAETESLFHFKIEVIITQDESLQRSSDENTDFTVNLYNSDTNELWASVKGTANYTYSDGVSVTINKANAVVTTYWSSLGVETVDDYILNNYSDASYICDFYLIRRTTCERVLYRFCFNVDCYGETSAYVYPIG